MRILPTAPLATAEEHTPAGRDSLLGGSLQQPRFADARLPRQEQDASGSGRGTLACQEAVQQRQLARPPHHRRKGLGDERRPGRYGSRRRQGLRLCRCQKRHMALPGEPERRRE